MCSTIQYDPDEDHSGLLAWVDDEGRFFSVEGEVAQDDLTLGAAKASPVARHVALKRQEWRNRVEEYQHAEDVDISGLPDAEQDEIFDLAGDRLDVLVETRAPDLAALAEKMRLIDKTGTYQADGYFEALLADVDALSKRAVMVPTVRDVAVSAKALIKRGLTAITPWWNIASTDVLRLESWGGHYTADSYGSVPRVDVQWLGLHVAFEIGRTPPKLTDAEKMARRAYLDHLTQEG
jgi:hypothetical protein